MIDELQISIPLIQKQLAVGNIFRDRGDVEEARQWYGRVTQVDPSDFQANFQMGHVLQLMGKPREAIRYYAHALIMDPNNADAQHGMGSALLQLGEAAEALPYNRRATEIDPESQEAWYNLGTNLSLLGRYEDAIEAYRTAAELGELANAILLGLADAHIQLGHYGRAVSTLRQAVEDEPSAIAYERLGYTMFKQELYDEALDYYEQALEFGLDDTSVLNGFGACMMTHYVHGGRKDPEKKSRALAAWRKSLLLDQDQAQIHDLITRFRGL